MTEVKTLDPMSSAIIRWLDGLATQGIFTTDREFAVRSWNTWLEHLTGRSAANMLGRNLFTEFPELAERRLDAHYRDALGGEARVLAHTFHHYFLRGPGASEPSQTVRIAPLEGEGGIIGTITMIEDVTDRIASERELRHQIETAEFARAVAEEAVRTKDEFLATLSHEIRTPLNAVVGWTKILQLRQEDPALVARALQVIERNASAQMHLIDDMLDMARIMSGKLRLELQTLDVPEIVAAALDVIAPTARARGVRLETTTDPGEHRVSGDPDRLQQVIWNLLSNAVKFTEPGGEIRVGVAREGTSVAVWVADTGAGISEEFMPHMFDRFRQAHASASRRQGGLGLGLPLVKQLVELHGGTVRATSVVGVGSTFTLTLPALAAERSQELPVPAPLAAEALSGLHMLVVEDQDDARELTVETLKRFGATVTDVSNCTAALDAVDAAVTLRHPIHAIVADIGLPDHDGYDFMAQLRSRSPSRGGETPAIALTACGLPRDRQRTLAAGFSAHLVKPADPTRLVEAVLAATQSRAGARRPSGR